MQTLSRRLWHGALGRRADRTADQAGGPMRYASLGDGSFVVERVLVGPAILVASGPLGRDIERVWCATNRNAGKITIPANSSPSEVRIVVRNP